MKKIILSSLVVFLIGCAGMKVIHPEDQKNEGTLAVDTSGGNLKLVGTYTCSIVASNGKRVSVIGKTEADARNEALAKCRDKTLISVCDVKNLKCSKN